MVGKTSDAFRGKCAVPSCSNRDRASVKFYRFPSDPERCNLWVQAIGDPDLQEIPVFKLNQLRYVCATHFTKQETCGKYLDKKAVPSCLLGKENVHPNHSVLDGGIDDVLRSARAPSPSLPHPDPCDAGKIHLAGLEHTGQSHPSCSASEFEPHQTIRPSSVAESPVCAEVPQPSRAEDVGHEVTPLDWRLPTILHVDNIRMQHVARDGNCFYASVSYVVHNSVEFHQDIRDLTMFTAEEHWNDVSWSAFDDLERPFPDLNSYQKYRGANGKFATTTEVKLCAEAVSRPILLYARHHAELHFQQGFGGRFTHEEPILLEYVEEVDDPEFERPCDGDIPKKGGHFEVILLGSVAKASPALADSQVVRSSTPVSSTPQLVRGSTQAAFSEECTPISSTSKELEECTPVLPTPKSDATPHFKLGRRSRRDSATLTPLPTVRCSRKMILRECDVTASELTPRKVRLLRKAQDLTAQNKRQKRQLKKVSEDVKNLSGRCLEDYVGEVKVAYLRGILQCYLRNKDKPAHARRYTTDDKAIALALFKQNTGTYSLIRKLFGIFPAPSTLRKILAKIPLTPGVDGVVLDTLQQEVRTRSDRDKVAILQFDEVALKPRLVYDEAKGFIYGFEDFGGGRRTRNLATQAQVFQVQFIASKKKQPVCYLFCSKGCKTDVLYATLKVLIRKLVGIGINVVGTVCDQGSANCTALRLLREHSVPRAEQEEFFVLDERKLFNLFDVPHLLKCMRNMLLMYRMKWGDSTYDIEHVKAFQALTEGEDVLLQGADITDAIIDPQDRQKMKVKYAAKLLSRRVSFLLALAVRLGVLDPAARQTAEVTHDLDLLFDLCNGPAGKADKPTRTNIHARSVHAEQFPGMKLKLKSVKFFSPEDNTRKYSVTPKNWIRTINAIQGLWSTVRTDFNFQFLNLRSLNQDSLENLFGWLRQLVGCGKKLNCKVFEDSLKTILVRKVSPHVSRAANCEDDSVDILVSLKHFLVTCEEKSSAPPRLTDCPDPQPVPPSTALIQELYATREARREESLSHVAEIIPGSAPVPLQSVSAEPSFPDCVDDPVLSVPELFVRPSAESSPEERTILSMGRLAVGYVAGYLARRALQLPDVKSCASCKSCLQTPNLRQGHELIDMSEFEEGRRRMSYPSKELMAVVGECQDIFQHDIAEQFLHSINLRDVTLTYFLTYADLSWVTCQDHRNEVIHLVMTILVRLLIKRKCKALNDRYEREYRRRLRNFRRSAQGRQRRIGRRNARAGTPGVQSDGGGGAAGPSGRSASNTPTARSPQRGASSHLAAGGEAQLPSGRSAATVQRVSGRGGATVSLSGRGAENAPTLLPSQKSSSSQPAAVSFAQPPSQAMKLPSAPPARPVPVPAGRKRLDSAPGSFNMPRSASHLHSTSTPSVAAPTPIQVPVKRMRLISAPAVSDSGAGSSQASAAQQRVKIIRVPHGSPSCASNGLPVKRLRLVSAPAVTNSDAGSVKIIRVPSASLSANGTTAEAAKTQQVSRRLVRVVAQAMPLGPANAARHNAVADRPVQRPSQTSAAHVARSKPVGRTRVVSAPGALFDNHLSEEH